MLNKKKIKIFHSAFLFEKSPGIIKQMRYEDEAAKILGISWDVKFFFPCNDQDLKDINMCNVNFINFKKKSFRVIRKIKWCIIRIRYYIFLLKKQKDFDVLILRYSATDLIFNLFLKIATKPIFLVHHTLEEKELRSFGGFRWYLESKIESIIGRNTISKAKGIIGVTQEILNYEIDRSHKKNRFTYVYPNGVFFKKSNMLDSREAEDKPVLLFIASEFSSWHGLDILLSSIKENNSEFILHLVGNLNSKDFSFASQDKRISLHGVCKEEKIEYLASKSWIGLSSLALFRNNMNEACPLKTREYLMLGLPVYSGHKDFFPNDEIFYRTGAPDLNKILEYAREMRGVSKQLVYERARPYIDKTILLKNIYNSISEYENNKK